MISAVPPGLSTRYISLSASSGRVKFLNAAVQTAKSKSVRRQWQVGGVAFLERDVEPCLLRIFVGDAYECFADVDPNHFPPLFLVETEYRLALMKAEQGIRRPNEIRLDAKSPTPTMLEQRRGR